jgi:hypothetical protein
LVFGYTLKLSKTLELFKTLKLSLTLLSFNIQN